jgi:hypothetical protein
LQPGVVRQLAAILQTTGQPEQAAKQRSQAINMLDGRREPAARACWQRTQTAGSGQIVPPGTVSVTFSAFPGENFQVPRSWAGISYPTLNYYSSPRRGGHFAAWEEPQLCTQEIRAAFRAIR